LYKSIVCRWIGGVNEKCSSVELKHEDCDEENEKIEDIGAREDTIWEYERRHEEDEVATWESSAKTPAFYSSGENREAGFWRMREFFCDLIDYQLDFEATDTSNFWSNIKKWHQQDKIVKIRGSYLPSKTFLWERLT